METAPPPNLAGTPFDYVKESGRGGMGVVVEAIHRDSKERCAVKLLLPDATGPSLTDRLRLEAETAAATASPHIVRSLGAGLTEEGAPYYAMELLAGKTLQQLARGRRMDLGPALRCGIQLSDGLSAAHELGVVHRDIKPANLFLCEGSGLLKILDFGIAKVVEPGPASPAPLGIPTTAGCAPGTVRWAPPEVLMNEGVDVRSDIYSAGLVLWSLLAGAEPWADAKNLEALLMAKLHEPLPALAELRADPRLRDVDYAITWATEKQQKDRPAHIAIFGDRLRRILREVLGEECPQLPPVEAPAVSIAMPQAAHDTERDVAAPVQAAVRPAGITMPTLRPGSRFEKAYDIVDVLGQGGMGIVYRARHIFLGREVAIKLIPLEASRVNQDLSTEFATEMQALAKLEDPNIVRIFDGGVTSDNMAFIVMELLPGSSLRTALVAKQPLTNARACVVLGQVAKAMAALHAIPMLHRDIKPENIMITPDAIAKLVDFGLARVRTKSKYVTRNPRPVGTLHYMPREQLLNTECDESADIHAFGVTMFECFTGRHPRTTQSGSLDKQMTIEALLQYQPFPPLSDLRPDLPPFICDLFLRCVDADPEKRPKAGEIVRAFTEFAAQLAAGKIPKQALGQRIEPPESLSPSPAPASPVYPATEPLPTVPRPKDPPAVILGKRGTIAIQAPVEQGAQPNKKASPAAALVGRGTIPIQPAVEHGAQANKKASPAVAPANGGTVPMSAPLERGSQAEEEALRKAREAYLLLQREADARADTVPAPEPVRVAAQTIDRPLPRSHIPIAIVMLLVGAIAAGILLWLHPFH